MESSPITSFPIEMSELEVAGLRSILSDMDTLQYTNDVGLQLPSGLHTPENVECTRKRRLNEATSKITKEEKGTYLNRCETNVTNSTCGVCQCPMSGETLKKAIDRNDQYVPSDDDPLTFAVGCPSKRINHERQNVYRNVVLG